MNINTSEFDGDIENLSNMLQEKLRKKIIIRGDVLQINEVSRSKVRDALKQSVHKLEPDSYRVISKSNSLKVKKLKFSSCKSKQKKGSPPSAPQTMPYFFPGRAS